MKTIEEQRILLEDLLAQARQRQSAGETEWMEFKTNIGKSRCSVTYEGVGNYISGLSNSACLKYRPHGYLILGVEDGTWNVVGTNLKMPTAKYGNQDYNGMGFAVTLGPPAITSGSSFVRSFLLSGISACFSISKTLK